MTSFSKAMLQQDILPFLRDLAPVGNMLLHAFSFFVFVLGLAFLAYWGREFLQARMEMRRPPSMKRLFCRLCSLMLKIPAIPEKSQRTLFVSSPLFALVFALFFAFFVPVGRFNRYHDFSLLYFLFVSSCCVYAFIAGGWGSGSRFAFFGAVRLIAQSLACQPVLAVIAVTVLMSAGASDMYSVIYAQKKIWFVVPHFPLFVLYLMCTSMMLAQAPFGAPKSAHELAGGIYAEYGGALYALFLFAENILQMMCAAVGTILFLGGTLPLFGGGMLPPAAWFAMKTLFLIFVLTLMRCTLPCWRTDKVMNISFKFCLPFSLIWLALTAGILYFIQGGGW